ncbi:hypothetical protein PSEUBRA_000093 [Kalmanozyma brasiliensis GHG001]|uniref:uncharacterized protein n=1 Tax=Kalmanozyma brasiliensis (strain GHG001) TaxID=1365824 RepID=UPI002867FA11|nr:uncharacterized protein PSEUBRA_000093 [Kalmanozyma brasiliensis GHG001]EST09718.2 hypothetical protein PSEUBRA_000093 [Kalmanozyma brasiliensis GHG001]
MEGSNGASRPAWAPKKGWSTSSPSTASSSRDPTPSSSSAFPPLSTPQSRRSSARPSPSPSFSSDSSLISSSTFNPYPTRRQELAQRAASHGTRKRSHITRSDPVTSRIHSILDYDQDDDTIMHDAYDAEDADEGEVSSRGATMSSIVFRDLSTSASTSRSSSPWQQGGLSPGLAMFATTSFGGEPLRVLANVDEELGAAHMGPRIYKRHNQKHVRNRFRAKMEAGFINEQEDVSKASTQGQSAAGRTLGTGTDEDAALTEEDKERLRRVDLQKLVNECRRSHALVSIRSRTDSTDDLSPKYADPQPLLTLLSAIRVRIAEPQTWIHSRPHPVLSDDLLPVGLEPERLIDFSVLPPHLLVRVRQSVLQGLHQLVAKVVDAARQDLISTLATLLSFRPIRPTSTSNPDLKPALEQIFLDILDAFTRLPDHISSPAELLAEVLASIDNTHADPLVDLVGELVGLCGQQMSSNPTILTETQDRTLVSASSFLSLCFTLNSSRPASTRLPTHAFYCTVLDLAPFLEHFVHHAASLVRTTSASGLAQFNICRSPFLLSLGAKVRALQLENELRLSRAPRQSQVQRFEEGGTEAELVVLPTSLSLKVERHAAWEQSKALFLQLLESGATVRGLRVVFAGEQAADGGGPAREWFASVASSWSGVDKVVGPHGWFIASAVEDEDQVEETAAFLGMLLALAALHTTKVALSFTLPAVAFKIATAPKLDELVLTPVDLEFADAALAKSLQSVLDWKPSSSASGDVDRLFDSTFSLTWSTSIRTADGEIKTIDLVPGGRHRSVKVGERRQFVSKLVWRVLVGSVSRQVTAFRDAWQSIMPSSWLSHNNDPKKHGTGITVESATDILSKGGLAASLFSPEELAQALLSLPTASSLSALSQPLDISDLRAATEVIVPSSLPPTQVVDWFWSTWSDLSPLHQRRLLAFITGAQDLPASGARGIGLRIHLVATDAVSDFRSWPLPWSSTCTSTLFLPTYPTHSLLADKVRIAIEHYQGFGLR